MVKLLNCSNLWALQCPKSKGLEDPNSKGSPPPICSICSSAQRSIKYSIVLISLSAKESAFLSNQSKKAGSLINATLIASEIPAAQSRSDKVVKKYESLKTAKGGAKVPKIGRASCR